MSSDRFWSLLAAARGGDQLAASELLDEITALLQRDPLCGLLFEAFESLEDPTEEVAGRVLYQLLRRSAKRAHEPAAELVVSLGTTLLFLAALERFRAGDMAAHSVLFEVVSGWVRSEPKVRRMSRHDQTLMDDAINHVLHQLHRGRFDPKQWDRIEGVRRWCQSVAVHRIISELRQLKPPKEMLFTDLEATLTGGKDGEEGGSWEPVAPEPWPDISGELVRLGRQLEKAHELVHQHLAEKHSPTDTFAFYLLELRAGLYGALYKLTQSSHSDPLRLLDIVEVTLPWSAEDSQRRIDDQWPTLGSLWERLRALLLSKRTRLSVKLILRAAADLGFPRAGSESAFLKRRERLRAQLRSLDSDVLAERLDSKARILWNSLLGLRAIGQETASAEITAATT